MDCIARVCSFVDIFTVRAPPSHQAEVDVNISVDVSSLVSSADLPVREGEAGEENGRERFYLTTAINYTNGAVCGPVQCAACPLRVDHVPL